MYKIHKKAVASLHKFWFWQNVVIKNAVWFQIAPRRFWGQRLKAAPSWLNSLARGDASLWCHIITAGYKRPSLSLSDQSTLRCRFSTLAWVKLATATVFSRVPAHWPCICGVNSSSQRLFKNEPCSGLTAASSAVFCMFPLVPLGSVATWIYCRGEGFNIHYSRWSITSGLFAMQCIPDQTMTGSAGWHQDRLPAYNPSHADTHKHTHSLGNLSGAFDDTKKKTTNANIWWPQHLRTVLKWGTKKKNGFSSRFKE